MNDSRTLVFGDDSSPAADIAWLFINNHQWPGWSLEVVAAHMPETAAPLPRQDTTLHPWTPPKPRKVFTEAHSPRQPCSPPKPTQPAQPSTSGSTAANQPR